MMNGLLNGFCRASDRVLNHFAGSPALSRVLAALSAVCFRESGLLSRDPPSFRNPGAFLHMREAILNYRGIPRKRSEFPDAAANNGILLSVIVPHYRSADSLRRLAESIPDRPQVELIIADDKSGIPLTEIEQAAACLKKTKVLVLPNDSGCKGAGAARNIALEQVTGQWLMCADADDYFLPGMWEIVWSHFGGAEDIVFFPPRSVSADTGKPAERHLFYERNLFRFLNAPGSRTNESVLRYRWDPPWSKLIRTSVVREHGIRFEDTPVANDVMFSAKCGYFAERVTADDRPVYVVTAGTGTLIQAGNPERFLTRVDVAVRKARFLEEHLTEDGKRFAYLYLHLFFQRGLRERFGEKMTAEIRKRFEAGRVWFEDPEKAPETAVLCLCGRFADGCRHGIEWTELPESATVIADDNVCGRTDYRILIPGAEAEISFTVPEDAELQWSFRAAETLEPDGSFRPGQIRYTGLEINGRQLISVPGIHSRENPLFYSHTARRGETVAACLTWEPTDRSASEGR